MSWQSDLENVDTQTVPVSRSHQAPVFKEKKHSKSYWAVVLSRSLTASLDKALHYGKDKVTTQ